MNDDGHGTGERGGDRAGMAEQVDPGGRTGSDDPEPVERVGPDLLDETTRSTLLTDLELVRTDIRAARTRQTRLLTSGIAASGLVLGYALYAGSTGSTNGFVLASVVPFIVGGVMVLTLDESLNQLLYERHARKIEMALAKGTSEPDFGWDRNFGTTSQWRRNSAPTVGWGPASVPIVDVPLHLFYVVAAVFYLGLVATLTLFLPELVKFPAPAGVYDGDWRWVIGGVYSGLTVMLGGCVWARLATEAEGE